jgi:hypothetical protein
MRELGHRFACRRLQSSAGMFTWTGQYELESPLSELVDNPRQGFQHGIRPARQTIVQQNDVSASRFAQNSPGKNAGIRCECITRPNAPRNILKAGILKIRGWRSPTGDRKRRGRKPQMRRMLSVPRSISVRRRRGIRKQNKGQCDQV